MKLRQIHIFFLSFILISRLSGQPTETTYLGNLVVNGYLLNTPLTSTGPFQIGFPFTYFGNSYTQFYVNENGLLMFVAPGGFYSTEANIPAVGLPNNYIAPFWDNLTIEAGGNILYRTVGSSPNRKLIIQWKNMVLASPYTYMGTFSLILYETTNVIQFQYRLLMDNNSTGVHGGSATIGLENSGGTAGVLYAYHNSTAITTGKAISFTPSGATYTTNSSAMYDGIYLTTNTTLPEPGIPQLLSPPQDAVIGTDYTFSWSNAGNAASYTLLISTTPGLSSATTYSAGTNLSYYLSGLSLGTTYYWSVFAYNSTGTTWNEIKSFTTSATPPLAAVPQTLWVEQGLEKTIKLEYTGGDVSAKTAIITALPAQGQLYQYSGGVKGSLISTVPTTVSDAGRNVIYLANGTTGNGAGNFSFKINDINGDSPVALVTINVSPPGIPNLLYAAKNANVELQFDQLIANPVGKQGQFTVKVNGSAATINSASLKSGDPYTVVLTLASALIPTDLVQVSYTQGDVASTLGGVLLSFTDQPVSLTAQSITFSQTLTKKFSDSPFTLTASASSGLGMTYSSSNLSVTTASGSVLTFLSLGSADITARQAGNATYAPAKYIKTLTVAAGDQTITFNALAAKTYGNADYNLTATVNSGLTISYSSGNTAVATIAGNVVHIVGAGTSVITASQAGNALWNSATPVDQTLTVNKASLSVTAENKTKFYGDVNPAFTVTYSGFIGTETVSVIDAVPTPSTTATRFSNVGTYSIVPVGGSDNNYTMSPTNGTLTVNIANQTITFNALPAVSVGDADFDPGAAASSGLTITYTSSDNAIATIVAGKIHPVAIGTSTITASQAGNSNFNPATSATQLLTVGLAQTITFNALPAKTYGDADFDPAATASSGLAVAYASGNPSVATIVSGKIHITGGGTSVITASQPGNLTYSPATNVTQTLTVNKASQTITFGAIPAKTFGNVDFDPAASANSGLTISYSSDNLSVATIVAGLIHIDGAGSANITASQSGNSNYYAASDVIQALTVNKAGQTITFNALPSKTIGDADFNPGATSSSGLTASYSSNNTAVATIAGGLIHITGAGTAVITATQAGNTDYASASDVLQTLTVNKADQTITFNPLPIKSMGIADFDPAASSSSSLQISYSSSNTAVATIVSNKIHIVALGESTITASQGGNTFYNAAPDAAQLLTVGITQTITFNSLPVKTFGDAGFDPGATASSGLAVAYSSNNTAVATISGGMIQIVGAGTATITASQPGDFDYSAASNVTQILSVNKEAQTITFSSLPTKVYGDGDFNPGASANSGLTISYSSLNTGVATISGGLIHIVGAGTAVITASLAGNTNYNAAPDVTQTLTVDKVSQTILFNALPVKTYGDADFNPGATAGSGLSISYSSSDNTVGSIVSGMIKVTGVGTSVITASQAGNSNYLAASNVTQTLTTIKANQTITFSPLPVKIVSDADFDPGATITSGLIISYSSSNTAVASIVGSKIHLVAQGTATITASQAGTSNYNAATSVNVVLTVGIAQSITFHTLPVKVYGDTDFDPAATASSLLPVLYASDNTAVATIVDGMIHITGGGTATITASQPGDLSYSAAAGVTQLLTVNKANQTITFTALPGVVYGNADFDPGATASSGLPVSYSSNNTDAATITGGKVHIEGAGSATITASLPGNTNYNAASDVAQVLTVSKASQTITFTSLPIKIYGDSDFDPSATAGSGLPLSYSSNNTTVATFVGGKIHIAGAGTAVIKASQAGNTNYLAAPDVTQTLTVNKVPLIATADYKNKTYLDANPVFTVTYTGFLGTEDKSVLDVPAVATTTALQTSNAGTYPITPSGGSDNNYSFSYTNGVLTVNKANQTITFNAVAPVTYGSADFNLTATSSSGLTVSYTSGNDATASISGSAVHIIGAGSAVITASQAGNGNYNSATSVLQTITVNKANLTIAAENKTKGYLAANPVLTYLISGYVSGETQLVLDVLPSIQTTAADNSPVANYPITVTGGSDNNYNYIYVSGIMSITRISQTITFSGYPEKLLVEDSYTLVATASTGLTVLFESKDVSKAAVSGDQLTGVANGKVQIRAYNTGDQNYNATEALVTVEIYSTHKEIMHLFTPNNDGINDLWELPELATWGRCNVKIYNRWGNLVFDDANYNNTWNGTSNGDPLPEGPYYYVIKTGNAGTVKGTVNIVR